MTIFLNDHAEEVIRQTSKLHYKVVPYQSGYAIVGPDFVEALCKDISVWAVLGSCRSMDKAYRMGYEAGSNK